MNFGANRAVVGRRGQQGTIGHESNDFDDLFRRALKAGCDETGVRR